MTLQQWSELAGLLENGWPGDFDEYREAAYFKLLAGFDRDTVERVIVQLCHEGRKFRPSAAEIAGRCSAPPWERLSWAEASRLIYAALSRHYHPVCVVNDRAMIAELSEIHPGVALFAAQQGPATLAMEPTGDPDIGGAVRKRLEEAWDRHLERLDDRYRRGAPLDPAGEAVAQINSGREPRRLNFDRAVAQLTRAEDPS